MNQEPRGTILWSLLGSETDRQTPQLLGTGVGQLQTFTEQ